MSLRKDEETAKRVLDEEYGVKPYVYYFGIKEFFGDDEYITGRIRGVTVVYHEAKARDVVLKKVIEAMMNATVDGDNFMYAGNLRNELEEIGIFGMSIWDYRDSTLYKLLTRTVATGRFRKAYERGLLVHKAEVA